MMQSPSVEEVIGRSPVSGRPRPSSKGFTLTEVLVALLITVIAVMGLAHTFGIGRGLIDRYATARDALGVAEHRMEWLRGEWRHNPNHPSLDPAITQPVTPIMLDSRIPGLETWRVEWLADPTFTAGVGKDYKRVTVTVQWTQAGVADSVRLSALMLAPS